MGGDVLLVACPDEYVDLLPEHARAVPSAEGESTAGLEPLVVIIGPRASTPLLFAQRLSRRHAHSGLVIAVQDADYPETAKLLQITPFVPVSTALVREDPSAVRDAVETAYARSVLHQTQRAVLDSARRQLAGNAREADALPKATAEAAPGPPRAADDLGSFLRFYDAHDEEIATSLRSLLRDDDSLGALHELSRETAPARPAQSAGEGVAGEEWDAYRDALRSQGRMLVDRGVTPHEWTRLQFSVRSAIREIAVDRLGRRGDAARAVVAGMDVFFEIGQLAVSEGFVEANENRDRAIEQRERLLRSVIETTADAILSRSLEGTITSWNPGAVQLFGYTADAAVGRNVDILVPTELEAELRDITRRLGAGESLRALETRRRRRDGTEIDVALTISPIRDANGTVVGASTIGRDITARRRALQALEEKKAELEVAQEKYRDLYDHAPDLLLSFEPGTRTIIRCNRTLERRLGYATGEIVGRSILDIYHPQSLPAAADALQEFDRLGRVRNARLSLRHANGTPVPVLLNSTAARAPDGRILYSRSAHRDLSDIVALESRKAAMLDGALDGIITIDHEGTVTEFNPAAESMFGLRADVVVGRILSDVIVPERVRGERQAALSRYLVSPEARKLGQRVELSAVRADGEEFPAEVSVVRLEGIEPPMFTAFVRDLTDLKRARAELERTVDTLKRSNEDLEQFAYVASHDLQEPLRMVTSYMELFARDYEGRFDERADQYIHFAVDGSRRMKTLVDDLLTYSRVSMRADGLQQCASGEALSAALENLSLAITEANATIVRGELPVIWGDARQMEQVFQNLVGNAIKFRGDADPRVSVSARRVRNRWRFAVEDNGIGFDARNAASIFQMFQRLHGRGRYPGSGIGLAITKRIVERHGGRIWAESTPGEGSRFLFDLPTSAPETGDFRLATTFEGEP